MDEGRSRSMDVEQRALEAFVKLHGHKLKGVTRNEPTAFLARYGVNGVALEAKVTAYSVNNVINDFDTSNTTVQFLLHQMQTYDPRTSHILGLIFSESSVLAHVIQCGAASDPTE